MKHFIKKSFVNKTLQFGGVFLFILIISACQKNEVSKKNDTGILKFESVEQYSSTLKKVLTMSTDELKEFENSHGYISFGRTCDEFYSNINFNSFNTYEDIEDFVSQNKEYIQLVKGEDGDVYLETSLSSNPERYFINHDKMFIINNHVYKFYKEGYAISEIDNINILRKIKNAQELKSVKNDNIKFVSNKNQQLFKDLSNNCGTSATARATKKRDRTKIQISIDYLDTYDAYNTRMTIYQNRVLIRPYKKTLGVWYWCKRTISCDIKLAMDFKSSSGWQRDFYYNHENGKYASKLEYIVDGGIISMGTWARLPLHYGGYDCWADTPSTDRANLECNTQLF